MESSESKLWLSRIPTRRAALALAVLVLGSGCDAASQSQESVPATYFTQVAESDVPQVKVTNRGGTLPMVFVYESPVQLPPEGAMRESLRVGEVYDVDCKVRGRDVQSNTEADEMPIRSNLWYHLEDLQLYVSAVYAEPVSGSRNQIPDCG